MPNNQVLVHVFVDSAVPVRRLALFLAMLAGIRYASKHLRPWLVARYTVLADLPALGTPRAGGGKLHGTVIICGGSMAGLLAARVCADHCTRVLVLDPDARALAAAACAPGALAHPPPHARVMQHGAPHGLQALYHHALGALFPGRYAAALAAAGAVVGPGSYNSVIGGVPLDVPMDMLPVPAREVAGASRACQEAVLRMLVAQDGRVEFVDGTVVGFEAHPVDGRRLGGVTYRTADDPKAVHKLQGDLIIDCTGAAHAGLALLQRLPAFAVPGSALESYHPHMRYGIGKFQHAHAALAPFFAHTSASERASPFVGSFVPLAGVENRWLALMRIEGDQLYVAVGGVGFTGAAESVAELREHARSIRGIRPLPEWVFAVLDNLEAQEAECPGEFTQTTISAMHWIKYHEHARTLPTNFVALGDAWMRLNPVWGQGCTLALMGATTLDGVLRAASGLAVGPAFFATLHTRLGGTWADMKARDYAYDACEPVRGEDRSVGAGRRAFAEMLGKRALAGDKDVQRRMLGVSAWVLPPTDMLAPSVLGKLALDWVLGR